MQIDVAMVPGEIRPDHCGWVFVVIDVLRATSSMITALDNGAERVVPVADYDYARSLKSGDNILLCGEENGKPIEDFDLSNSPFEYTTEKVAGKTLVQCTSNGTKAVAACGSASKVFAGAFVNVSALCARLKETGENVLCVCSGESGKQSFEDFLCAGRIVDELGVAAGFVAEGARIGYKECKDELYNVVRYSVWGEHIAGLGYEADIRYCTRDSVVDSVPIINFNPEGMSSFPVEALLY
jgi:2-phosphosulfolactate phosphatase